MSHRKEAPISAVSGGRHADKTPPHSRLRRNLAHWDGTNPAGEVSSQITTDRTQRTQFLCE